MNLTTVCVVIAAVGAMPTLRAECLGGSELLSGRELAKFLGPVSPKLMTWCKFVGRDAESYTGTVNPPVSGIVTISLFLPPWKPDLGVMPGVDGPDRLGVLHGTWSKGVHEGVYLAGFSFADRKGRYLDININSAKQSDVDQLAREVSQLPMFNSTPETPFHPLEVRNQVARVVAWLLLPFLFLLSIALPERHLRKKRASGLRRTLTIATISAVWIAALLILILFNEQFRMVHDIIQGPPLDRQWRIVPAMALACLVGATIVVFVTLLRKLWGGAKT
jgi:hypothetical protein